MALLVVAAPVRSCGDDVRCWKRSTLEAVMASESMQEELTRCSDLLSRESKLRKRALEAVSDLESRLDEASVLSWYEDPYFWAAVGFVVGSASTIALAGALR